MSRLVLMSFLSVILAGCGDNRVYQEYSDFTNRYWLVNDTAKFQFTIQDTTKAYNVYCNIRNSTQYPYSRIFINFTLKDTVGSMMQKSLLDDFLFDPKSGKPYGKTGLGDLYDHQLPVLKNHRFKGKGPYLIALQQYMRTDTLDGILSVGVGIEKAE